MTIQHNTTQHNDNTTQYSTTQYNGNTTQYNTTLHNTIQSAQCYTRNDYIMQYSVKT